MAGARVGSCTRRASCMQVLTTARSLDIFSPHREELRRMEREVRILSMLNHPYIIAYRCCFQRDDLLCIVTEYAGGGNLKELIRQHRVGNEPFSSGQVLIWLVMIAS